MTHNHTDNPLMHLLMYIGKLLRERMSSALIEGGIHFGQARILVALLKHEQLSQVSIGRGLDIRPATVTNMVKKMEASGLIERRRDANDDRIINVTLTPKGKEAANLAMDVMAQVEDEIRRELTVREAEDLLYPLLKVRNTLGGNDPAI